MAESGPTFFDQFALRLFGGMAQRRLDRHPQLPAQLLRAGDPLVPLAYLASLYLRIVLAAAVGALLLGAYLMAAQEPDPRLVFAMSLAPLVLGTITYTYYLLKPDLQRAARRRDLEGNLPYALNFLAALASAGVVPDEVFGALGRQKVYGEVAREAMLIHRDTKLFGKDLVTALRDASRRSPSQQFEEFLQGAVGTVTSGGNLKAYLLVKAEHFSYENQRQQRAFLESMGVMAESYVVVAAAAPLFLIVILSVMILLEENVDPILFLNLIVLVAMPIIHGAFTLVLRNLRPD